MNRLYQTILISSTIIASWLGMQGAHEFGHVIGAWLTGGRVDQVVWHPFTISRTDLATNPKPLIVAWAGPMLGVVVPLLLWVLGSAVRLPGVFLLRFFAGFCLLANGLYVGVGSFEQVGDCGEMLRHGSERWQLWLFGAATAPVGLWLWHGQGPHFGFGPANGQVNRRVALGSLAICGLLLVFGLLAGER